MFPLAHLRSHGRPGSFSPTPATTPRYLRTSLGADAIHGCAARRCDGRKRGDARCNKFISPSSFVLQHHIKLRHGRHRRQHGGGYLPGSFVPDTDEPERGNWGPWSTPSSCSRSCGGGVAHQTRQCLDIEWVLPYLYRLLTFIDLSLTLDPRWNIARSYRDIGEECRTRRRDGLLGTSMWTRGTSQYHCRGIHCRKWKRQRRISRGCERRC